MKKIRLIKVLLVLCVCVAMGIFLFSTQYNTKQGGFVRGGLIHNGMNYLSTKISNWFHRELHGQYLSISYQDRFCRHVSWNKSSRYPPVSIVAKQLGIKDGETIFINGIHCGEWNLALKGLFPNVKLYGVDKSSESIAYVKELVNGSYTVSRPFELDKSGINIQFDHAIVDNILHTYAPELQCKVIRQMMPLLKAGGSLYIGKTYENYFRNRVKEINLQENKHIQLLPSCFWSHKCLYKRSDIVEILYSKDIDFMTSPGKFKKYIINTKNKQVDLSNNSYSLFIYKHILLTLDKDSILPVSRYREQHKYKCTYSEIMNATKRKGITVDKEGIRKAVKAMKLRGVDMH